MIDDFIFRLEGCHKWDDKYQRDCLLDLLSEDMVAWSLSIDTRALPVSQEEAEAQAVAIIINQTEDPARQIRLKRNEQGLAIHWDGPGPWWGSCDAMHAGQVLPVRVVEGRDWICSGILSGGIQFRSHNYDPLSHF